MSNKNVLIPYRLATAQDMTGSFNSNKTNIQYMDRVGIAVNVLSGSAVGNFKIQGRVSYSTNENSSAQGPSTEWSDFPNTTKASPSSGSSIMWDLDETSMSEIRVVYTTTSGTGTCDIWITAKRSG